ncbi:uncharacterized protein F4812DRAFT_443650 [Daldinia caldariorum]|uniref:uncharacterized protein n=1 Tax=Daldinia caldariorum TaxID=326644 RepID=UPI002007FA67|nr:uncharacterized protein F4812DRAFT_443650 [Daldinia caldariorum]KAI1464167.1 hypothetical protein F4812DRAFT_443650 [Daldinia caldariorum]
MAARDGTGRGGPATRSRTAVPAGPAGPAADAAPVPKVELPRTSIFSVEPQRNGRIWHGTAKQGRWPNKRRTTGFPEGWQDNEQLVRHLDALEIIQATRTMMVTPSCLDVTLGQFQTYLAPVIAEDVNIVSACEVARMGEEVFCCSEDKFNTWLRDEFDKKDELKRTLQGILRKPYTFWPIDACNKGPHRWVVAVIYLRQSWEATEDVEETYDMLHEIAVIDPQSHLDEQRTADNVVLPRVISILEMLGVENYKEIKLPIDVWVPPLHEPDEERGTAGGTWSSGLRVFSIIREIIDRMTWCYSKRPKRYDHEALWGDLSGYFNPDRVRTEMMGLAAMACHRVLGYITRVGIEPIRHYYYGELEVLVKSLEPGKHPRHWNSSDPGYDEKSQYRQWSEEEIQERLVQAGRVRGEDGNESQVGGSDDDEEDDDDQGGYDDDQGGDDDNQGGGDGDKDGDDSTGVDRGGDDGPDEDDDGSGGDGTFDTTGTGTGVGDSTQDPSGDTTGDVSGETTGEPSGGTTDDAAGPLSPIKEQTEPFTDQPGDTSTPDRPITHEDTLRERDALGETYSSPVVPPGSAKDSSVVSPLDDDGTIIKGTGRGRSDGGGTRYVHYHGTPTPVPHGQDVPGPSSSTDHDASESIPQDSQLPDYESSSDNSDIELARKRKAGETPGPDKKRART